MAFFRNIWKNNSKHKKLYEEWALTNIINKDHAADTNCNGETDEANFSLKYIGGTLVEAARSERVTADAIKTILKVAKTSGKKLQNVTVNISPRGIRVYESFTEEEIMAISIYRISFCSADATHDQVFAFISIDANEVMECHAFLCPKRKITQLVTLTLAQSFNRAYDNWREQEEKRKVGEPSTTTSVPVNRNFIDLKRDNSNETLYLDNTSANINAYYAHVSHEKLIDLESQSTSRITSHTNGNNWVNFDDGYEQQNLASP